MSTYKSVKSRSVGIIWGAAAILSAYIPLFGLPVAIAAIFISYKESQRGISAGLSMSLAIIGLTLTIINAAWGVMIVKDTQNNSEIVETQQELQTEREVKVQAAEIKYAEQQRKQQLNTCIDNTDKLLESGVAQNLEQLRFLTEFRNQERDECYRRYGN